MDTVGDQNSCRICLKQHETVYSIYCKQSGLSPSEKLIKVGVKSVVNDGGPTVVCCECLAELDITVNFLEKCKKSNQILSEKLPQVLVFSEDCKDIINAEHEINAYDSNAENSQLDSSSEVNVNNFKEDVKGSILDLTETKCAECGSKRRCKHWTPPTTHTCPYCQKVFNRKFNFKLHIARHGGVREWACTTCGARAVSRWLAHRHCWPRARTACPVPGCCKTYTTNTNLQTHLRTHNGERPFQCSECNKRFTSKNTLNDHMRIHTGALPYMCPVCGKRFRTNKLSAHMSTHARRGPRRVRGPRPAGGEASYECAWCPARYHHKQSLNKHVRKQHTQKAASADTTGMERDHTGE